MFTLAILLSTLVQGLQDCSNNTPINKYCIYTTIEHNALDIPTWRNKPIPNPGAIVNAIWGNCGESGGCDGRHVIPEGVGVTLSAEYFGWDARNVLAQAIHAGLSRNYRSREQWVPAERPLVENTNATAVNSTEKVAGGYYQPYVQIPTKIRSRIWYRAGPTGFVKGGVMIADFNTAAVNLGRLCNSVAPILGAVPNGAYAGAVLSFICAQIDSNGLDEDCKSTGVLNGQTVYEKPCLE